MVRLVLMRRGVGKAIALVVSVLLFVASIPLHRTLLPGNTSWGTLAALAIFVFGFVGVFSAVFDRQSVSSKVRSAGIGIVLLAVGRYIAFREPDGWRAIPVAALIALGIWAVADGADENQSAPV
jgi:drug/metabolite transporter (DMT)-like permease